MPSAKTHNCDRFTPRLYFFYGSLRSPQVVKNVLKLPELPFLFPASVFDHELRVCGHYHATISALGRIAHGMVYLVCSEKEEYDLQDYKSTAYSCGDTWIMTEDGEVVNGKMRAMLARWKMQLPRC